jgi:spore coat polysaccharide biosynthesis predicted glycosyltransferase SpsG/CMP-N-acetylneuraminic acid synthetase
MNSKFLINNPLVSHTINKAKKSKYITDIYVSTDSDKIKHIADLENIKIIDRPLNLADPDVVLNDVIIDAWIKIEKIESKIYDYVITLQPNTPLVNLSTIDKTIEYLVEKPTSFDTAISVKEDIGLFWLENSNGFGIKNYKKRENSLQLTKRFKETGAFLISKRENLINDSRIGNKVKLVKLSFDESIEIKKKSDWWVAEKLLKRKKILIRVDGYNKIGLGHIYRTLLVANRLIDHNFIFVSNAKNTMGIDMIKDHNYDLKTFSDFSEYKEIINEFRPDIIINDILDTESNYIKYLKEKNIFVVNFEDMGPGAKDADIVINALYDEKYPLENHYWGKDYYCLREEFQLVPKKEIDKEINNILITFGGTDSNNYTERLINILKDSSVDLQNVKINIVLGLGYENKNELKDLVENINLDISIMQNIKNISKYMYQADLVFTSAGRTIYELASIGTPTIVLAQNNRELRHRFANSENGIVNLGLGYEVADQEIKETFENIVDDYELRKRCNKLMLKNDLRSGVDNVLKVIFEGYDEYKEEEI